MSSTPVNGDGEALTFQFNGGGGTIDLAETMTFLTNEKKDTVTSPFLLTGVAGAALPSSSPTQFLNPADYEKTITLSAHVTVGGVRQAVGVLNAFADNQMRGIQATPGRPPFGPYLNASVYQIVLYTNGDGETLTFQFNGGRGVVNLEETMTFITDKTVGSANSPFIFSGVAAPPSSAPRSFNPADYESRSPWWL